MIREQRTTNSDELVPLPPAPFYAANTWGPYYDAMHPPATVHWMVVWKGVPTWIDHAVRLWRQRQTLRTEYVEAHGNDPEKWPTAHPGVVLDGGLAACLGCHWLADAGYHHDNHREEL